MPTPRTVGDEQPESAQASGEFLNKALSVAIRNALEQARTKPWSAEAPWIMAFKEWTLAHGVDDPSGAMLWADLHIGTILHAVNNYASDLVAAYAAGIAEGRRLAFEEAAQIADDVRQKADESLRRGMYDAGVSITSITAGRIRDAIRAAQDEPAPPAHAAKGGS